MNELERNLPWIRRQLVLTEEQLAALPTLDDVRLACSVHLEAKLVPVVEALIARGAAVFLTSCNSMTTRNDVVSHLVDRGADAWAWQQMTADEERDAVGKALEWGPTHLCEMGAELTATLAKDEPASEVRAALEATGSGISRLHQLAAAGSALPFPVFNWDDLPIKEGLHNRHMVGMSTWHTFIERTRLSLHGKQVLVIGYGLVGQGLAAYARAFGGRVSVTERDPARLLEARYAGFDTGTLEALAPRADIVVTATGASHVLSKGNFGLIKEGSFLLNVGHVADEIQVEALGERRELIPFVEEVRYRGKTLYLFAGGSMANLTAGQGDMLDAFDVTLATMVAGLRFVFSEKVQSYHAGLHPLPRDVWEQVAQRAAAR